MTRRLLTTLASALIVAAMVVGGSAIAAGKKTKTYKVQGTAYAHPSGEGTKIAGTQNDKYLGNGAVVYPTAVAGNGVKIPFTSFFKNGSYAGKATADVTMTPTGATITNCTLKITSGGGAYKRAKGTGTCGGTEDSMTDNITVNYKGSIKVPK